MLQGEAVTEEIVIAHFNKKLTEFAATRRHPPISLLLAEIAVDDLLHAILTRDCLEAFGQNGKHAVKNCQICL